jgi:hypothetical protein
VVKITCTRLRPPANSGSRYGRGIAIWSLSITQLRTEEREHIRVELLVEGTAVKAGGMRGPPPAPRLALDGHRWDAPRSQVRDDSPLEEDGFELAVPPRRERLWAATPGKHCRFGPEPVSGSASAASTCCVGASSRSGPKISRSALRTSTRRLRGSRTGRPSERHSNGVAAWSRSMTFTSGRRPRKAVFRRISFSTRHYRSSIGTSHGVKSGKTFRALHVNP